MAKAVSRFTDSATVSCPPLYRLVSCNIFNVRTFGGHDRGRYAIPTSITACQCKDSREAYCQAWCSNVQLDFTIVSSDLKKNIVSAACPAGYKV